MRERWTPRKWETIELNCCRCKTPVTFTRERLDRYERESRVALCQECAGEELNS